MSQIRINIQGDEYTMLNSCSFISTGSSIEVNSTLNDVLSNTNVFLQIIVNIVVILGGILGFNYIKKLREKQLDSTFTYLTRLNIRLKYFRNLLLDYRDEIMDCFLPEGSRREISADRVSLVNHAITNLAKNAKETLNFLKEESNQMPAQQGWIDCFNVFVEFLIDCEKIDQDAHFKWIAHENIQEEKEEYYNNALDNINKLLEMVYSRQSKLEHDIFKKKKDRI